MKKLRETTGTSAINITYPCHIQTTDDRIWIRLPHFSGIEPSIVGSAIAATVATDTDEPGSSTGGVSNSFVVSDNALTNGYTKMMRVNQKLNFTIGGAHYLNLDKIESGIVTLTIFSMPQTKALAVNEEWKVDVDGDGRNYDLLVKVTSVTNYFASVTIKKISEAIPTVAPKVENTPSENEPTVSAPMVKHLNLAFWIIAAVVLILIIVLVVLLLIPEKRRYVEIRVRKKKK